MTWVHALRQEQYVHKILLQMTKHGWDVNRTLIESLINKCISRMQELDEELLRSIPLRVSQVGSPVLNPFKKNGEVNSRASNYVDATIIAGPFTAVRFDTINLGSEKQLKEYLFSIGWKPDEWNYNKKTREVTSPKITESSLESLEGINAKAIKERIQAAHRLSQLNGWLENIRPDGRVPMIISGMTPTYRCTHKIVVNVPGEKAYLGHEMRACFITKQGYKLVGIDSKSNQLRGLCHYMKDDAYTQAVVYGKQEDGTDIHSVNQRAAGLPTRAKAKTFIYGLLFGAQDAKIGQIVDGTEKDGTELRRRFMARLPAFAKMMIQIEAFYKQNKYLLGLDGRVLKPRAKHQLLVYLLQAFEAVYMKVTLAFIQKRAKAAHLDFQLVGFVHDELQYMVKEDHVEQFSALALQAFIASGKYLKISVPMEGDLKVGNNWSETH